MFYYLTEAVQKRFIQELRAYWSYHPRFKDLPENIQMKFSFKERPQHGIVLKSSSASPMQLSADNFQATLVSHVAVAKFEDKPGLALEWVREDARAIQEAGGVFPSPAGVYYVVVSEGNNPEHPAYDQNPSFCFYVDPLLEVEDELSRKVDAFTWSVARPYLAGTTRVVEMPGAIPYVRGTSYTENPEDGTITLLIPVPSRAYLLVSYKYAGETTGPWPLGPNHANTAAIPGVVLCFGDKLQVGDVMAVLVHKNREPCALEYGGRWSLSLDFEVIARDVNTQQVLTDQSVMYLWGVARNRLSSEGIEVKQVSAGGDAEESYNDTSDENFYTGSFSVEVETDWSIHVPITAIIQRVSPLTDAQARTVASMNDAQLLESGIHSNIAVEETPAFKPRAYLGKSRSETIR